MGQDFWVDPGQADEHPWRYGDLVAVPEDAQGLGLADSKGRAWRALMITHPSCEVVSKGAPDGVQAARVYWLREVSQRQQAEIMTGYVEVDETLRPARVHQVYLAPAPGTSHHERMFADLRKSVRVPLANLQGAGRVAAMSHDARLAVLRRDVYFRYRWPLTSGAVLELERSRIVRDGAFQGPRPTWATP